MANKKAPYMAAAHLMRCFLIENNGWENAITLQSGASYPLRAGNPEFSHSISQGAGFEPKEMGSSFRPLDPPSGLLQRGHDMATIRFIHIHMR